MESELRLAPQGETLEAYNTSRSRVTFLMGPLGSGKTVQSCINVLEHICEMPPNRDGVRKSRWVAVRNSYPDLMGTTIKDWMELADDLGLGKLNRDFPPTYHMDFDLEDGTTVKSELVFMALDRPDAVRKLRGLQATGFWLNEVKELQKEIVDMCDGRHGRYPSASEGVDDFWHGMIGDYNAPDTDHWLYKLAEEERPEGWTFLRQPSGVVKSKLGKWEENPDAENLNNLPDGYYIRQVAGKSDDWINVNLANNYGAVVTGKPIYKDQFNEIFHITTDEKLVAIKSLPIVIGFDFGLTPAAVIGQLTSTGQLRILREIVSERYGLRGFLDDVVLPVLAQEFPHHKVENIDVWFDPSGVRGSENNDESCSSILSEKGFRATPAPSNDPMHRWEAVRWFLQRFAGRHPAFLMNRECATLKKGFISGYQFRRLMVAGEARYDNKADKNHYSHIHDAIQYLCLGIKGMPSEDSLPELPPMPSADELTAY